MLWEIVTHEMPQRGTIRDVLVPSECPQEVADLISACMQRNAKARPSAREVCRCAARTTTAKSAVSSTSTSEDYAPDHK